MSAFQLELGGGRPPVNLGEGWAGLENLGEAASSMQDAQFQQMLDLASQYRSAFATPAGAAVLEDLARQFMFKRIVQPGDDEHSPGIRQGQSDVVQRIVAMIEFANTGGGRVTGQPAPKE